jgi:hypothetical protein
VDCFSLHYIRRFSHIFGLAVDLSAMQAAHPSGKVCCRTGWIIGPSPLHSWLNWSGLVIIENECFSRALQHKATDFLGRPATGLNIVLAKNATLSAHALSAFSNGLNFGSRSPS